MAPIKSKKSKNKYMQNKSKKNKKTPNNFAVKWKKRKVYEKVTEFGNLTQINAINHVIPKVTRILPHWLRYPENIESEILVHQKKLSIYSPILDSILMDTLQKNAIEYLFPVQSSVIKEILSNTHGLEFRFRPRDICVAAPTGCGKTLSYVLPIIQVLRTRNVIDIRAVIILPVTDLAVQVAKEVRKYGEPYGLVVGSIYGEESISAEQDILLQKTVDGYKSKVDILVCTPGRLAIHLSQTTELDFSKLRFFVLDEADHLLTGDWSDTLSSILKRISSHQQTSSNILPAYLSSPYREVQTPAQKLLFSATLSHNPQQLRVAELHNPLLFATSGSKNKCEPIITEGRTGQFVRPPNLVEEYLLTPADVKGLCLFRILLEEKQRTDPLRALVFGNSVEIVHHLFILLRFMAGDEFKVESFSSANWKRRTVLKDFHAGKINVLISTDAMARGIDVEGINCVISYEVVGPSIYIHRAGRTARAGKPGKSISIVTAIEMGQFRKTLGKSFSKATELKLSAEDDDKYNDKYKQALNHLSVRLKKEIKSGRGSKFTNLKQNHKALRKFIA